MHRVIQTLQMALTRASRAPHTASNPRRRNHPAGLARSRSARPEQKLHVGLSERRPSAEPVVLFDYQLSRAQHHPQAFLNGYTGKLISDGYLAWRSLQGVTHFGCWAHARRRFDEALKASPQKDGRAEQALT